jgi:hypothetical protein
MYGNNPSAGYDAARVLLLEEFRRGRPPNRQHKPAERVACRRRLSDWITDPLERGVWVGCEHTISGAGRTDIHKIFSLKINAGVDTKQQSVERPIGHPPLLERYTVPGFHGTQRERIDDLRPTR